MRALERELLLRQRAGGDHRRGRVYRRDDQLARRLALERRQRDATPARAAEVRMGSGEGTTEALRSSAPSSRPRCTSSSTSPTFSPCRASTSVEIVVPEGSQGRRFELDASKNGVDAFSTPATTWSTSSRHRADQLGRDALVQLLAVRTVLPLRNPRLGRVARSGSLDLVPARHRHGGSRVWPVLATAEFAPR